MCEALFSAVGDGGEAADSCDVEGSCGHGQCDQPMICDEGGQGGQFGGVVVAHARTNRDVAGVVDEPSELRKAGCLGAANESQRLGHQLLGSAKQR